jgi:CreA protein
MTNRKSRWCAALVATLMLGGLAASPGRAADEPDLIFKRSTVFKWLTPNDKLATYGLDDPEVRAGPGNLHRTISGVSA